VRRLASTVSIRRALVAAVVLPAMVLGLRLVLDDSGPEGAVAAPVMLDTPASDGASKVGLDQGRLAPDFEISTTEGGRVRLSDFRGRPVVVNFHALWCTSCLTELPEIKAVQEERGLDTFAVLAVNSGESKGRALELVEHLDAPFVFGLDTDLTVSDAYGVHGLPATVFIDAGGVIQAVYAGYTGKELLNTFLDAAIDARPPGDIPVLLRTISTIPRERILNVSREGSLLSFSSRSLRCDALYCAEPAVRELAKHLGLSLVEAAFRDSAPTITVEYDAAAITAEQVTDAVSEALRLLADPVYTGEMRIVRVY
jgi:peroxiredoxin